MSSLDFSRQDINRKSNWEKTLGKYRKSNQINFLKTFINSSETKKNILLKSESSLPQYFERIQSRLSNLLSRNKTIVEEIQRKKITIDDYLNIFL